MEVVQMIAVADIRVSPVSLRTVNEEGQQFLQLRDSIAQYGVQQSISVRPAIKEEEGDERFVLIDGLHRLTAARQAGIEEVPAMVCETEDQADVIVRQTILNSQRIDMKPIEYTRGLMKILSAKPLMTQTELAQMVNMSTSWVMGRLQLLKLNENIQQMVDDDKINLANAVQLAKLPEEEQEAFLERAITEPAVVFGEAVQVRKKELTAAARKGEKAEPAEWAPVFKVRKPAEIKAAIGDPGLAAIVCEKEGADNVASAFLAGLAWCGSLDVDSRTEQRAKYDAIQARKQEERDRRAAELEKKKAAAAAAATDKSE